MSSSSSATIFAWDDLPTAIQYLILRRLPISVLLRLKLLSPSFLSPLHPLPSCSFPRDPLFLLFSFSPFYHPLRRRYVPLHPHPLPSTPILSSSSSSHLLLPGLSLLNPFNNSSIPLPPLLPMPSSPYPIALLSVGDHFQVVVVSTADRVVSQIYDSGDGRWVLFGELPGRFHLLGSAVFFDGLVYVLAHGPDRVLTLDLAARKWGMGVAPLPAAVVCAHLMGFRGRLMMVGGVEEGGAIARIGVWEMEKVRGEWWLVRFMAEEGFGELSGGRRMEHYDVCERSGIVCFYNRMGDSVVMWDLVDWEWWRLLECPVPVERRCWIGQSVEPGADLLL